jgi:cysteinyl-tRNA synthetase
MSKSLGNFFTLRDLVLKGHKPSSIRYLLTSVPYRNQLNFTFDGLRQAATSVERLRNFRLRLQTTDFPPGAKESISHPARETAERLKSALEDDLNTAQAQAAIFEMIRAANAAMDAAQVRQEDARALLETLEKFDQIFAVLHDDDASRMKAILDWAQADGRSHDISKELLQAVQSGNLSDEQVNQKLAEMEAARKARKFNVSDALRAELNAAGIIVENVKGGVRWKRK